MTARQVANPQVPNSQRTGPEPGKRCRIGIDVGGTFTDFVLAKTATGELHHFKEPSIPADPSRAVENGIAALIARAGVSPGDVELIVHGTTLALNAIIQRRGAKIALVVSQGNRDVLEIARCRMPNSYDFTADKEEPLVPRDLVFEVGARLAADGRVLSRPEDGELAALAAGLREEGVAAVTVMLLHSYLHPALEREVAAALRARLPGVLVSESAQIWPEMREYERALVGVLNAYIHPLMESYFSRLSSRLREAGFAAPIYITASNGGTLSIETARERPIDTVLSGPASGVIAAIPVAAEAHLKRIITFDMGGTSSDIALSKDGEPESTMRTTVGDFPLILPVVNVSSIGAGGGSIVSVDAFGVLKIGPQSAGADPGPACYGRGGTQATVTDCYLIAGYIDPAHFLGGRMKLDRTAAQAALESVADRLGFAGADRAAKAAEAALRVATAVMATELFKGLAQRGEDPRQFALMPFGGAGPTHANLLAREARLASIVIPAMPGTFCAMGAILADVKRDYVRSLRLRLGAANDIATIRDALGGLQSDALAWARREGDALGKPELSAAADMHYAGEVFDLHVAIPETLRQAPDAAAIAELFHAEHERLYGFRDHESAVEIATVRVRVLARLPPWRLQRVAAGGAAEPFERRRVYHEGAYLDVPVYRRSELGSGTNLAGPAIVEQEDSTSWILPGWIARVDAIGSLILGAA